MEEEMVKYGVEVCEHCRKPLDAKHQCKKETPKDA